MSTIEDPPPILDITAAISGLLSEDFRPRFEAFCSTLSDLPGVQRTAFAFEYETPETLHMFVNWSSSAAHAAFATSPEAAKFVELLSGLFVERPVPVYGNLKPPSAPSSGGITSDADADKVLQPGSSTTTEVVSIFFPSDMSSDAEALCERNMPQFARSMKESKLDGLTGIVQGWALHDTPAPTTKAMSKAYIMLFGWTDIKRHAQATKGEAMRKIMPLYQEVYDMARAREMEMYHVQGLEIKDSA